MAAGYTDPLTGTWVFGEDDVNPNASGMLNRLGNSIRSALTTGTGWVTIASAAGYTIQYKYSAGDVEILCDSDTANVATGFTDIAPAGSIPAAHRPPANRFGLGYLAGYVVGLYIRSNGSIVVNNTSGAARLTLHGSIQYKL